MKGIWPGGLRWRLATAVLVLALAPAAVFWDLVLADPLRLLLVPTYAVIGMYWVLAWVMEPLRGLLAALQRAAAGDRDARLLISGRDEVAELGAAFNAMADQLAEVTVHLEQKVEDRTAALVRKADQLRAVGEVGQQIAAVLETDRLLHFVAAITRGTFGYEVVAVLLRRGDGLNVAACSARAQRQLLPPSDLSLACPPS